MKPLTRLPTLTSITIALVTLSVVIKLSATLWLKHQLSNRVEYAGYGAQKEYTYQGDDYPSIFPLSSPRHRVRLGFEETLRYQLETEEGAREWAELVPGGDGLVYLGNTKRPFSVALFHQLKCLDILRAEVVKPRVVRGDNNSSATATSGNPAVPTPTPTSITAPSSIPSEVPWEAPSALSRHCLNYVKQMILCRGDVHLESFNYASHRDPIDQSGNWECRDWEVVYREARKSQEAYWKARQDPE